MGFASVMATGIISVAASELGLRVVSWAFAGTAFVFYAALVALAAHRRYVPPGVDAFAVVAATAVLGSRLALAGAHLAAAFFLLAAVAIWLMVWAALLRELDFGASTGTRLLAVVSTQSLAIQASLTAHSLARAALAVFVLGLLLYPWVLRQLPASELRSGDGDVWIAMGALAISALAAARLAPQLGSGTLQELAFVLWLGATCWIPVLVAAELRWPRARFEPKRWSTVFPIGMYTAAFVDIERFDGLPSLTTARVCLWIAISMWALTAIGALLKAVRPRFRPDE